MPAAIRRVSSFAEVNKAWSRYFAGRAAFGIAAVGTMMCAYFVPFHITHGPPVFGSVGSASNWLRSVGRIMMWGGLTTH